MSGVDTAVHYIYAGGEAVAIYKSPESGSAQTLYLHRDHLGSVVEITDESGAIYQSLSYDAFGKRRDPDDWGPPVGPPDATKRGYTGHEHLDDVGIVHMNGRVYDPDTARMLSADPYVALPTYSQSYNRYAYVLNNPLSLVDPSGFLPEIMSQPVDAETLEPTGPVTNVYIPPPSPGDCLADCQAQRDMNRLAAQAYRKNYRRLYDAGFLAGSETIDWGWGGVIGWTTVSISVSYQGIFWPMLSESVANNAMTGTDTHPQLFENTSNTLGGALWDIGSGVALAVGGLVPWLGDVLDVYDIVRPGASAMERGIGGVSIGLNVFTAGFAPNAGPIIRGGRRAYGGFTDLYALSRPGDREGRQRAPQQDARGEQSDTGADPAHYLLLRGGDAGRDVDRRHADRGDRGRRPRVGAGR